MFTNTFEQVHIHNEGIHQKAKWLRTINKCTGFRTGMGGNQVLVTLSSLVPSFILCLGRHSPIDFWPMHPEFAN
jgi:hypothetical protein